MQKDIIVNGGNIQSYTGVDAYKLPLIDRIKKDVKVIYQIIDATQVAKFHKYTDDFVLNAISKRVEYGIQIKNLICYADRNLEIEISNPESLKETRYLPKEVEFKGVFSIYGDAVSFCNLSEESLWATITKDKNYVDSAKLMFDGLWEKGVGV